MKFEPPAPSPEFSPGVPINVDLPFFPADFDPGNGAGLYVPPQFDRGVDIEPWRDVTPELRLPPWFTVSEDFKPNPAASPGVGPSDDGRATRYVEGVGFYPNAEERPLYDSWTYEIASVYVPKGCFGVLYRMDCHLVAAYQGQIVNYNTPLDPWKFIRDFHLPIHYYLKLERPKINLVTDGVWPGAGFTIPGVPHPDLGGWNDSRYSWGNNNYPLRLLIPEDNYLKLYFTLENGVNFERPTPSQILAEIGGRLIALVSNYRDNERAIDTARRGW